MKLQFLKAAGLAVMMTLGGNLFGQSTNTETNLAAGKGGESPVNFENGIRVYAPIYLSGADQGHIFSTNYKGLLIENPNYIGLQIGKDKKSGRIDFYRDHANIKLGLKMIEKPLVMVNSSFEIEKDGDQVLVLNNKGNIQGLNTNALSVIHPERINLVVGHEGDNPQLYCTENYINVRTGMGVSGLLSARTLRVEDYASVMGSFSSSELYVRGNGSIGGILEANEITASTLSLNGNSKIKGILEAKEINTEEIKVQVGFDGGADFVFEEDYKLRSLEEVEAFVKENKHLPEIAPAAQMREEGVKMADFQIQLLQKVEELTLYMIELKKENEDLREKIEKLEEN